MTRRVARIPPRRPIFLGCEGSSEAAYGTLIAKIAREVRDLHVHIHVQALQPGAGDPLELVKRAAEVIDDLERRRSEFAVKAVLLDAGSAEKTRDAVAAARDAGIEHLIWQAPDHEALLLRHLRGCEQRRPPAGQSLIQLRREWKGYEKGMSWQALAERIGIEDIRRACTAETELNAFLRAIGLIGVGD
jgi:hypothetical protein